MLPGYQLLATSLMPTEDARFQAMRLNALCSLYYFIKVVLRKHRINPKEKSDHFHIDLCNLLEKEQLKELIEIPRDHFKTTIGSEGFSMWRALPVSTQDIEVLTALGYDDAFIKRVLRQHNRNIRILIVSEIEPNAIKIGERIKIHYESNDLFRTLFPEILPDSTCIWSAKLRTHKRDAGQAHGEGTYNFLGTGSALQSNHFDIIIQDDLIGRDTEESNLQIEDGIRYHQLLVGAFDNASISDPDVLNDEIVIGNRWAEYDLNDWIRENESYFNITSHSALGGCCDKHPDGIPIFPEEFSVKKLGTYKTRQGPYIYSCQFENRPVNQDTRTFKDSWLRFYHFKKINGTIYIEHEQKKGFPDVPDVNVNNLLRYMVVDPKHKQVKTRCNHGIVLTGIDSLSMNEKKRNFRLLSDDESNEPNNTSRKYILDTWSDSADFSLFIAAIYDLADKWKLNKFWLEVVGAQTYLKYHIEQENERNKRFLDVEELKTSTAANAKDNRITAMVPYFKNGEIWVRRDHTQLLREYETYPTRSNRPIDLLDLLGYCPQVWDLVTFNGAMDELEEEYSNKFATANLGAAGY
jgi:hypothetical protein